jgi:predicted GIY-YIG superfamily endonuclease
MKTQHWYVYVLLCKGGSLYTGATNDVVKRLKRHQKGTGAKYTKAKLPVTLVYYETYATKSEALKREYAIKQMRRSDKFKLVFPLEKEND